MAINPNTKYPGKTAGTSTEYPFGKARNITTPGDGTGTPWEEDVVNDLFGFQQAMLKAVGRTPSTTPEEVGASQYLQAIMALGNGVGNLYLDTGAADAYVIDPDTDIPAPETLLDGFMVRFVPVANNTGASTVNVAGFGVKSIVNEEGNAISALNILAGYDHTLRYDLASDKWVLVGVYNALRMQVFTSSGVYTRNALAKSLYVECVGGGGGGGGAIAPGVGLGGNAGAGGGGGGCGRSFLSAQSLGTTVTVTVGAGGAGGSTSGGNGGTGGGSAFGTHTNGAGGVGGTGDLASPATVPERGVAPAGAGGSSTLNNAGVIEGGPGGIGAIYTNTGIQGAGGGSAFCPTTHGGVENVTATSPVGYGGGGCGAVAVDLATGYAGGDGADGIVVVWELF